MCEVKRGGKIVFHVNSCETNLAKTSKLKNKKRVVWKDIFLHVTLMINQKLNVTISRPLYRSAEWQTRELSAWLGD